MVFCYQSCSDLWEKNVLVGNKRPPRRKLNGGEDSHGRMKNTKAHTIYGICFSSYLSQIKVGWE